MNSIGAVLITAEHERTHRNGTQVRRQLSRMVFILVLHTGGEDQNSSDFAAARIRII